MAVDSHTPSPELLNLCRALGHDPDTVARYDEDGRDGVAIIDGRVRVTVVVVDENGRTIIEGDRVVTRHVWHDLPVAP